MRRMQMKKKTKNIRKAWERKGKKNQKSNNEKWRTKVIREEKRRNSKVLSEQEKEAEIKDKNEDDMTGGRLKQGKKIIKRKKYSLLRSWTERKISLLK